MHDPWQTDPLAAEGLVDARLPADWDSKFDLAVLSGSDSTLVAGALCKRGQARLLIYLPSENDQAVKMRLAETAPPAKFFQSLDELALMLDRLAVGRPPQKLWFFASLDDQVPFPAPVKKMVDEAMPLWLTNYHTAQQFGERWAVQGLANLPALMKTPSITTLRNAFSGKPAIIVSPGPSLKKNISQLKALQDRAVIISSLQTLKPLFSEGVIADFALVIEAVDLNYMFAALPPQYLLKLPGLVLGVTIHPDTYYQPLQNTQIFSFASNNYADEWLYSNYGDEAHLPGGGSVSCAAIAFGSYLGCSSLTLVGQDLSFSDGKMYIDTAPLGGTSATLSSDGQTLQVNYRGMSQEVQNELRQWHVRPTARKLPGYDGGEVVTTADFFHFHGWFVRFAEYHKKRHRFYNSTEGGAFIPGMEHLPLAEVSRREFSATIDKRSIIETRHAAAMASPAQAERRARISRFVRQCAEQLRQVTALCRRAADLETATRLRKLTLSMEFFTKICGQRLDPIEAATASQIEQEAARLLPLMAAIEQRIS